MKHMHVQKDCYSLHHGKYSIYRYLAPPTMIMSNSEQKEIEWPHHRTTKHWSSGDIIVAGASYIYQGSRYEYRF